MSAPAEPRTAAGPTRYWLDPEGRIVRVNAAFDRFAAENAAPGLTGARVVGQRLDRYIADPTVRLLWDALLERARQGHAVVVPFRCDAPGVRRFMRMVLRRAEGGLLECEAVTDREEPRPPVQLLAPDRPAEGALRMCSWCKRLPVGEVWVEVEEAADHYGLFDSPVLPALSHGMCPQCAQEMERLIG